MLGQISEDDPRAPERTVRTVVETVARLRQAWDSDVAAETGRRFDALADHYTRRLATLPVCHTR
ncbi:hypothetical protein [Micromonospora sp. CPCC 205561]|uniref:hypothetical protein n=1 Tax=Micromonospora sp. CPCC 205561 TaxID=3122407 RepID=UPI002FEFF42C